MNIQNPSQDCHESTIKPKKDGYNLVYYADTETYLKDNKHTPYLFIAMNKHDTIIRCHKEETNNCVVYAGLKAIADKAKQLKQNKVLIYFHNLAYDITFVRDYMHRIYN